MEKIEFLGCASFGSPCIVISGIPQKENENLREIISKWGTRLNVAVHDYDVSTIHRRPSNITNKVTIIAKFNNRDAKND